MKAKKERTRDKKRELFFWKSRFNVSNLNDLPDFIDHLNLRLEEISDQELSWLCNRIHSINRLDLDDNPISDEGIKLLLKLDTLKELRLKGILELTDKCVPFLQKLSSLELLHLGGTSLSIDGILQLNVLKNLKILLFSLDDQKPIQEINSLSTSLPDCKIIISNKIYSVRED